MTTERAFREWWQESYSLPPGPHAVMTHVAWGEHLLRQPPELPDDELVEQWHVEAMKGFRTNGVYEQDIATQAARWGADKELEACCKLLELSDSNAREFLTAARCPKPPSLKEQALHELNDVYNRDKIEDSTYDTIRRALEALDD